MTARYLKHLTTGRVYGYSELLVGTKNFMEISKMEADEIRGVTPPKSKARRARKKKVSVAAVEEPVHADTRSDIDEVLGDGADA